MANIKKVCAQPARLDEVKLDEIYRKIAFKMNLHAPELTVNLNLKAEDIDTKVRDSAAE